MTKCNGGLTSEDWLYTDCIYQETNDIQGGVSPKYFMQGLSVLADILKSFDMCIWSSPVKVQCYVLSYSLNKVFFFF